MYGISCTDKYHFPDYRWKVTNCIEPYSMENWRPLILGFHSRQQFVLNVLEVLLLNFRSWRPEPLGFMMRWKLYKKQLSRRRGVATYKRVLILQWRTSGGKTSLMTVSCVFIFLGHFTVTFVIYGECLLKVCINRWENSFHIVLLDYSYQLLCMCITGMMLKAQRKVEFTCILTWCVCHM